MLGDDPLGQESMAILEALARAAGPSSTATLSITPCNLKPPLLSDGDTSPTDLPEAWSESSLRQMVEALPDAVVVISPHGLIALINLRTTAMFEYGRDELIGRPIELLVPERFRQAHVGHRNNYFREPRTRPMGVGLELQGRRKDGSEFPVEIGLSPLVTDQGAFAVSVVRDITGRKREEAKYRTLVENIPAVTFVAPLDQTVGELYVSPHVEKLLGFTQQEWLADPVLWYKQLHPDDRERWNGQFAETVNASKPFRSVYRFVAKDGRVVWVDGAANLVRDAEGRLLFLQGVAFDVTGIKEAEEERERFFSLSVDLFCVVGTDGLFKRVNRAFTRTLGHAPEDLLQTPLLDFVHPDDRDATVGEMNKLAGGGETIDFENRYRCRDGSYKWLQWSAAPYLPRQLIYAVARDVTQQKEDEEALRRLNSELEQRVAERTEALSRSMAELQEKAAELVHFAQVVSHDLKPPLRSLVSYPQKFAKQYRGRLDEQADDWIARTINGAMRMDQLLKDISRYKDVLPRERTFAVVEGLHLVQEACANLQAAIEEARAEVIVGELPSVRGVPNQLMLLFQNLIGNAIKYRVVDRPVRVEVRADPHPEGWLFRVSDNGIGIETRFYKKIFGIGVESRLHSEARYPGTGFGLGICEKIVSGHGGRIWVESVFGEGSTFFFTLPTLSPSGRGQLHDS